MTFGHVRSTMDADHAYSNWRRGQEIALVLWLIGVPTLAVSLAFDVTPFVSAGGWCLLAATLLDAVNIWSILRHAFLTPNNLSAAGS